MQRLSLVVFFFAICFLSLTHCRAQSEYRDFQQSMELADSLLHEGDFEGSLHEMETLIADLIEQSIYDSLYLFTYKLGAATRSLYGGDASVKKTLSHHLKVEENDPDTFHILHSLNDVSWVYYEAGRHAECMDTDREYLELCERFSQTTPKLLNTALYNVGFNHITAGANAEALKHFKMALAAIEGEEDIDPKVSIDSFNALGSAYWHLGDLDSAKYGYARAMSHIEQLSDSSDLLLYRSNTLGNLSLIAQDEGNQLKAAGLLRSCINDRQAIAGFDLEEYLLRQNDRHLLSNYRNLASIFLGIGDYHRALRVIDHLHHLEGELLEKEDPKHAQTLESYGSIHLALGNFSDAARYFEKYLELTKQVFGDESAHVGKAYHRLGALAMETGDYERALGLLNEAEVVLSGNSRDQAGQLTSLKVKQAECFMGMEAFSDAAEILSALINARQNASNDDRLPIHVYAQIKLANCLRLLGNLEEAEALLSELLTFYENEKEAVDFAGSVLKSDIKQHLPLVHFELAKIHHTGDNGRSENRSMAIEALANAAETLEKYRYQVDSEFALLEHYQRHRQVFDFMNELLVEEYREENDPQVLSRLLLNSELDKSLMIRSQLSKFANYQSANVPDSLIRRVNQLEGKLSGRALMDHVEEDYFAIEDEYNLLLSYIREQYQLPTKAIDIITTAEIGARTDDFIASGRNLLRYIRTDKALFALVLNTQGLELFELDATNLSAKVEGFHQAQYDLNNDERKRRSLELFNVLFAPLEAAFDTDRIVIVPDGELFMVNFECLSRSDDDRGFLIYDYTFGYDLSLHASAWMREMSRKDGLKVLSVAPGFSDAWKERYQQKGMVDEVHQFCLQQPFAIRTADKLASTWEGDALLGEHASESNFKKLAGTSQVLHLGTHGELNNVSPMLSRLILGGDEENDGFLHAYEIYDLALHAELAVLSACETGVGQANRSEGAFSLAHSFIYAGCPSVVMTLWKIDEKTSAQVTEAFYQFLSEGQDKDQALRLAKLEYLKEADEEMMAPYFWAGMVLLGDTTPLEVSTFSIIQYWPFLLLGAVLLTWLMVRRRKALRNH